MIAMIQYFSVLKVKSHTRFWTVSYAHSKNYLILREEIKLRNSSKNLVN